MAILNLQINEAGQSGVVPRLVRIDTDNTRAEVTATGYLNNLIKKERVALLPSDIAVVTTSASPNATTINTGWYDVVKSGDNWSLVGSIPVVFAGQHTTAGGAADEAITVTGALATDLAFVQMVDDGTNNVTIVNAVVTADTLTVTFSADPGNDAKINYQLIRAAS